MRLKELREAKHESQQRLAVMLEVSQAMISRYELEQTSPDASVIILLAKHYGVSADYLLGLSDDKLPYSKSNLSKKEQEILFLYKRLDSTQKEKALSYIQGMLGE